jgi:transcriptional regulator with XRE-family HTH domain
MDVDELGAFLKSRRARVRPADAGLSPGPRRRVPGLRRDEVAQLAGASTDYYTELERGRGARPSAQMLGALARALRLDRDERDYLYRLAGRHVPPEQQTTTHVQPAMLRLLDRLETTPAQIITDLHEVLVQNRLAVALLGPPPKVTGMRAGLVYRWFTDPESRAIYPEDDHARHSRVFVADLRAAAARRGGDKMVRGLIATLKQRSEEFAALWETGDVGVRRFDHKRIVHPELGVIELDCENLFSEDGRQRLLWLSAAPGTPAAEQLELLSVIGVQDLGGRSGASSPVEPASSPKD